MKTNLLRHRFHTVLILPLLVICSATGGAQQAFDGYTLFSPNNSRSTYLIDMQGTTVHTWQHSTMGGYSSYLLPDGLLLRAGSAPNAQLRGAASSGLIEKTNWGGSVVWSWTYSSSTYIAHHDIEPMPNGNVLIIAWEVKTPAEVSAAGRTNVSTLWPDHLVEVRPVGSSGGTIVWEWHAWDHLVQDRDPSKQNYGVVAEHPELIDVNLLSGGMQPGGGDWLHINGISYNTENDLIVISSHFMNEIYVIDHSTTTEEAAGHSGGRYGLGGDILYRWGNPSNYDVSGSTVFDVVHCSAWVPAGCPGEGHILAFNNNSRTRASVIVEIEPPVDGNGMFIHASGEEFGPATPAWTYSNGNSFFSEHLGGNQRLPNGNTLLTESTRGRFREVTDDGTVVWDFNYGREVARSLRYPPEYSGLSELYPTNVSAQAESPALRVWNMPNPVHTSTVICFRTGQDGNIHVVLHDILGRTVRTFDVPVTGGDGRVTWNGTDAAGNTVAAGVYFYRIQSGAVWATGKLLLDR